ncbi:hypothetical protein AMD27_05055 [Acinetobacter sp. TGL-Y2]|uniref:hypothetical protein n=1 Tax=Acinetobacter sp. TGL-Y2 TaxID=1407071 RepID=UPI0007A65FCB|nr:hypothetical protein [Acinetobacter sp. TGL-Y2]AMW78308.1 hypothetical protein AMD27_05055 [Acinetobacter sp. TGL-Y2]
MSKHSSVTYKTGCAISEDMYYMASTLDAVSEYGFTRMFMYDHIDIKWYYHDLDFTVVQVCLDDVTTFEEKFVYSLGEDGEVEKFDGVDGLHDFIPNSGLNADWSDGLGYLNSIKLIGKDLYACGGSGQIYKKIGSNKWASINIEIEKQKPEEADELFSTLPDFPDALNVEIYDINGFSENDLYIVGQSFDEGLVAHYNGVTWSVMPKFTPAALLSISLFNKDIIICGDHGSLIIGNIKDGFNRLTSKGIEYGFNSAAFYNDSLYIASQKYLYTLKDGVYSKVKIRADIDDQGFHKVEVKGKILWVLTLKFILRLDGSNWSIIDNPSNIELNKINSVKSNEICPQQGYWFTVAQENSRQYFKQGDIFPHLKSDWGDVYWQFDGED